METIATSVQPLTALETIAAKILEVEEQIKACSDYEERKQLRKKEEQLREKELIFLRLSTGVAPTSTTSATSATSGGEPAFVTQVQFADLVETIQSIVPSIKTIVPIVLKLSIERNNLWTPSKINDKRGRRCRQSLMNEMGYTNKCTKTKDERPKCMISGLRGGGDKVVCGHIVPCGSELVKLNQLGITEADLNLPKNCLFWCIGFEHAYESLGLSFVKSHPLQDKLYLKFWNDEVKTTPIWPGSAHCIGEFDGVELKLDGHVIMKRGLSYQAYQAYLHRSEDDHDIEGTSLYGSPGTFQFKSIGTLMEQQYRKDVEEETGEDEDDIGGDESGNASCSVLDSESFDSSQWNWKYCNF